MMLDKNCNKLLNKLLALPIDDEFWISTKDIAPLFLTEKHNSVILYKHLLALEGVGLIQIGYRGESDEVSDDVGAVMIKQKAYSYLAQNKHALKEKRKTLIIGFVLGVIASILAAIIYAELFS